MIGRQTLRDAVPVSSPAPVPARERLTLLVTTHAEVHRTFADAVESCRSGPLWRQRVRLLPAGLVHAAELKGDRSLCGLPLDSLHEFGRSRHPFERFDEGERCPVCHTSAGPQRP
ncbi:MAG: hypothetical protein QOH37_1477 [Nocardioidaceae bacterium]|nr:hypothetical protein [Nocardioidaceae bacterium]